MTTEFIFTHGCQLQLKSLSPHTTMYTQVIESPPPPNPQNWGEQEFSKSPKIGRFRGRNRPKRRQVGLVYTP